jgi:creatinine amidohydrolase
VHPDRYVVEYPTLPVDFGIRPLQLHEVSTSGVFGDPRPASAATGELLYAATVSASAQLVQRFLDGASA